MTTTRRQRHGLTRLLWLAGGLLCVGAGGLGAVLPGLPSTIFFIGAAACFTRSSPRLERWVLDLPGVGQMVRDHRAGLGMPRRAKLVAITSIAVFSTFAVVVSSSILFQGTVGTAAVAGMAVVWWRVPTREHVIVTRGPAEPSRPTG